MFKYILFFCLLFPFSADAFTTSPNAFRIIDSKEGNLLLGAEEAVIEPGEVYGTVVLLWGNLTVHGQVEEVVVVSGKVVFEPTAKLTKTLVVVGGSFESKPGSQVAPESVVYQAPGPFWRIIRSTALFWRDNIHWIAKVFAAALLWLVLWGFGLFLFGFFPSLQGLTAGRLMREWPKNLFVGLFGSLVVPVFFVLLVISILGIFLLPIYFLFLLLGGVISYLAAGLWIGHRFFPARPGENLHPWGFLLGLGALQLLLAVGVWWAFLPGLLIWTLGWGALLRGGRRLWR